MNRPSTKHWLKRLGLVLPLALLVSPALASARSQGRWQAVLDALPRGIARQLPGYDRMRQNKELDPFTIEIHRRLFRMPVIEYGRGLERSSGTEDGWATESLRSILSGKAVVSWRTQKTPFWDKATKTLDIPHTDHELRIGTVRLLQNTEFRFTNVLVGANDMSGGRTAWGKLRAALEQARSFVSARGGSMQARPLEVRLPEASFVDFESTYFPDKYQVLLHARARANPDRKTTQLLSDGDDGAAVEHAVGEWIESMAPSYWREALTWTQQDAVAKMGQTVWAQKELMAFYGRIKASARALLEKIDANELYPQVDAAKGL